MFERRAEKLISQGYLETNTPSDQQFYHFEDGAWESWDIQNLIKEVGAGEFEML